MKKIAFIIFLVFLAGCTSKDFGFGLGEINKVNSNYGTDMESSPQPEKVAPMILDFKKLKEQKLSSGQEAFDLIIDYRIASLEADIMFLESQKYGESGTTGDGFGCKQRPLIIETANMLNSSALKGFEAVELLNKLVEKYPNEAKSANISVKNSLFLNATFYQVSQRATKEGRTINGMCSQNRTLELYKEEFRNKGDLGEDYINHLTYEEAVKIWKESKGYS